MTTLLFYPQFHDPIRRGTKTHTIRRPRSRPIPEDSPVSLRYWTSIPYRSLQAVLLDTYSRGVEPIVIDPTVPAREGIRVEVAGIWLATEDREAFAVADGFAAWPLMVQFWRQRHTVPFEGRLIHWLPPKALREVLDGPRGRQGTWEAPTAVRPR